jgi:hypothetical protein
MTQIVEKPIYPVGWVLMSEPWEKLPTDDIREHFGGMNCACGPDLTEDDIIEHRAFDRREDYEQGKRRVS